MYVAGSSLRSFLILHRVLAIDLPRGKRGNTRQNECVRIPGRGWLDTWRLAQVVARCVNGRKKLYSLVVSISRR